VVIASGDATSNIPALLLCHNCFCLFSITVILVLMLEEQESSSPNNIILFGRSCHRHSSFHRYNRTAARTIRI
jgi:hypothetical protein